jgi:hypothetical protein
MRNIIVSELAVAGYLFESLLVARITAPLSIHVHHPSLGRQSAWLSGRLFIRRPHPLI